MKGDKRSYRWLVLLIASICNGMTWGLLYAVGVLYKDWVEFFDAPASYVSFAGGLAVAVGGVSGPIYGYLLGKMGMRKCCFSGGLIMAVGMAASSFVTNVFELCFTFGVLAGFGAGFSNYAACTLLNDYFVSKRMLAEGVIGGGLNVGTFIFSLLQQHLTNLYAWNGAMLITGAICLHLCVCAMLFIPFEKIDTSPLNVWKSYDYKQMSKKCVYNKEVEEIKEINIEESKCDKMSFCDFNDIGGIEENTSLEKPGFFTRSLMLFRNPVYLLILTTDFISWIALFIPYVHLVERGKQEGLDENTSAWLSSSIGLAGIAGRPLTGFVCNYFHFHPLWSYCSIQMLCGISAFLSSFWSSEHGLFTFAILFGFFSNGYGLIKASVTLMLEPECFADSFSWMLLLEGIGVFVGPTLAGFLYDKTGSYNWSFRFSGVLLIVAASFCFLKSPAEKLNNRRNSHNNRNTLIEQNQQSIA